MTIITVRDTMTGEDVVETFGDKDYAKFIARIDGLMSPGVDLIPGFDIKLVETDDIAIRQRWDEYCAEAEAEAASYPQYSGYHSGSCYGDYGPSHPWDAPGMCAADFVRGCSPF